MLSAGAAKWREAARRAPGDVHLTFADADGFLHVKTAPLSLRTECKMHCQCAAPSSRPHGAASDVSVSGKTSLELCALHYCFMAAARPPAEGQCKRTGNSFARLFSATSKWLFYRAIGFAARKGECECT